MGYSLFSGGSIGNCEDLGDKFYGNYYVETKTISPYSITVAPPQSNLSKAIAAFFAIVFKIFQFFFG
jgi:hypothetical protein